MPHIEAPYEIALQMAKILFIFHINQSCAFRRHTIELQEIAPGMLLLWRDFEHRDSGIGDTGRLKQGHFHRKWPDAERTRPLMPAEWSTPPSPYTYHVHAGVLTWYCAVHGTLIRAAQVNDQRPWLPGPPFHQAQQVGDSIPVDVLQVGLRKIKAVHRTMM